MIPAGHVAGRRPHENWGQPSGGADFLVDAGSTVKWQGVESAR